MFLFCIKVFLISRCFCASTSNFAVVKVPNTSQFQSSVNRVSNDKQSQTVYSIVFTRKLSNCLFLMLLGCFHGFWPNLTELKSSQQVQCGRNAIDDPK